VQPSPPTPPLERALVQPAAEAAGAATETGHLRQGGYGSPAPDQAKASAPAAATEAAVAAAQGALAALLEKAIGAMAGHVPLQVRARPRALSLHVGCARPPRALCAGAPHLAGPGCKGSRCCLCSVAPRARSLRLLRGSPRAAQAKAKRRHRPGAVRGPGSLRKTCEVAAGWRRAGAGPAHPGGVRERALRRLQGPAGRPAGGDELRDGHPGRGRAPGLR